MLSVLFGDFFNEKVTAFCSPCLVFGRNPVEHNGSVTLTRKIEIMNARAYLGYYAIDETL